MTAATAAVETQQRRSARDAAPIGQNVNPAPNLDAPRFFVQMVWDQMNVDTQAIPNRYLLRGEITPCRSFPQKSNIFEIREGERIHGMDQVDSASGDKSIVWGYYWKRAQHEADRLVEIENSKDSTIKLGFTEIKSLSGYNAALYEKYDFNQIFYPDGLENLPAENLKLIEYLEKRVAEIATMDLPAELQAVLPALGAELIAAAKRGHEIQSSRLDFTHRCMMLSPADTSGLWKRDYDTVDEEMLIRTGKPRLNKAQETTAEALHLLAGQAVKPDSQNDAFAGMIAVQREQNELLRAQMENQNKLIETLLAERAESAQSKKAPVKVKNADNQ